MRSKTELRHPRATHGMSDTPLYRQWAAMVSRCTHANRADFHRYGGRGITVAAEWRSFEAFYRDMGASWRPGLTLDRIDNEQGYKPGNCEWRTRKAQALNTCRTNFIDTPWGRMPLGEAAERTGIDRTTIHSRIKAGTDPFR